MIWPILEARAEIQKYFRSFFGSNENFNFAFEINWPLVAPLKVLNASIDLKWIVIYVDSHLKQTILETLTANF